MSYITSNATRARKDIVVNLQGQKKNIDRISLWQEMPDGAKLTVGSFDGLLYDIGKIAEATTETVAGVKATTQPQP